LPYQLVQEMSHQIKNPVQLLVEILKNQILLYESYSELTDRDEPTKRVENLQDTPPLDASL